AHLSLSLHDALPIYLSNADAVKTLAFALKNQVDDLFLVLGCVANGKPMLTVVVAENLVEGRGLNAGTIIRELAREIQGGGGGQRSEEHTSELQSREK